MGQGVSLAYRFKFLKILDSGMLSPRPGLPTQGVQPLPPGNGPDLRREGDGSTGHLTEPRPQPQPLQPQPTPWLLLEACARSLMLVLARSARLPGLTLISCCHGGYKGPS